MRQLLKHRITLIWLLLLLLTGTSWLLAEDTAPGVGLIAWLSTGLVMLSLFKVRLVGLHFMELGNAPLPLRFLFESWVVGVCISVIGIYWLVPAIA